MSSGQPITGPEWHSTIARTAHNSILPPGLTSLIEALWPKGLPNLDGACDSQPRRLHPAGLACPAANGVMRRDPLPSAALNYTYSVRVARI
jgi:hypothetical protein